MFLHKPKYSVKINLERDEVFFNGSAEESEPQKLQGVVEVSVPLDSKSTSLFPLHMSLTCNLKIKSKDLFSTNYSHILFKLNWSFKCSFKTHKTLKFPFVAKLPGDLPVSLDLDDLKINYQFRAYEECPLMQFTIITKDISVFRLSRIPRPEYIFTHANTPEALTKVKGRLAEDCAYSLSYPTTWYDMNKAMPIKLRLTLNQNQRVHSVIYSIRQAVSLGTLKQNDMDLKSEYQYQLSTQDAYIMATRTSTELLEHFNYPQNNSNQNDNLLSFKLVSSLQPYISSQKKFANLSSNNFEININHYLLAQITIIDSDVELISKVIRLPLTFLKRPKLDSNLGPPPKYEEFNLNMIR
ncbi:hypothetical protein CONCODRAFT_7590 [Conidiobolus coronatus NRRL 28638]|uniref:Arrestin-like N-terminal domain-containing protein n=1 Tax=Conidiobolus coronatus (strain ATCC 28846 / CBS 209.66 / NRRL 28638) TaxID=796925 RepID=A0A137P4J1_CONC2|nr:hypothetical protein CONCODRAFT_7590 [Conidiobolus coronatus NRRL 28638]|eukprot:KXN69940.1 hypothetical protein CONCODRAFT_7590 [Conidiobolus coronatus NRRL 28638]